MKLSRIRLTLLLLGVMLSHWGAATAQVVDPLPEVALRDDAAWITGKLPNGLTWYVRKNAEPAKRAELRLIVNAGSILETNGQQGLAHFVEHMCFNGTKSYTGNDLIAFLQSMGTDFGADLNAYTSFDETVYMLQIRTDSAGLLDKGLHVLQEWAHEVKFDPKEIDKERGVILEEKRLRSGSYRRMMSQISPVLHAGSRYPDRMPIGTEEVIMKCPHDTLIQYYRDWYRPDLMAVVAVGDFEVQAVIDQITKLFSQLPANPKAPKRKLFTVPPHAETKAVVVTDPELTNTAVQMHLKRSPFVIRSSKDFRRHLTADLISTMFNTRMTEAAHQANAPFTRGFQFSNPDRRTLLNHTFMAVSKDGRARESLQSLTREYERVLRHGFTASELERARTEELSLYEQYFNERDKMKSGDLAGVPLQHYLNGEVMISVDDQLHYARELLPQIDLAEIQKVIQEWMGRENRVFVIQAPEKSKAGLPTAAEVLALVQAVEKEEILPYVDADANLKLVNTMPNAGKVVERKYDAKAGLHQWKLSNGASVWIKATDFKNDEVLFQGWAPGGYSTFSDEDLLHARFAVSVVEETGIAHLSDPQVAKVMQGKNAYVYPRFGESSVSLNGEAAVKDLESLLQLNYLYSTQPRNDAEDTQSAREKLFENIRNKSNNPMAVYYDSLVYARANYHPRARPSVAEDVNRLDTAKVFGAYRGQLRRAQDFTYLFVGNVDTAVLRPLVERWIASLPKGPSLKAQDRGVRPPKGQVVKTVRKGVEPKSQVQMYFTGEAPWSSEERVRINLLTDYLQDRLMKNLREEQGGVYTVSVSGSMNKLPYENYSIAVSFGCAPENVDKLKAAVLAEIEALKKNGADADLFAQRKTIALSRLEKAERENRNWLSWLAASLEESRPLPDPDDFKKKYEAVQVEDMKKAAQKYLTGQNRLDMVLYPEES